MRRQIRIVGIDDCAHKRGDKMTCIVGAFFRGGDFLDGVISTEVAVDGDDSTQKIAGMINASKFKSQTRAILLNGIAVGGFNIIDIHTLNVLTGIPIVAVVRKMPNFKKIHSALKRLGWEHRIALLDKAGVPIRIGDVHVQFAGTTKETVEEILKLTCKNSSIPEPIRVAHLISGGIKLGESRGRA